MKHAPDTVHQSTDDLLVEVREMIEVYNGALDQLRRLAPLDDKPLRPDEAEERRHAEDARIASGARIKGLEAQLRTEMADYRLMQSTRTGRWEVRA